MLSESERKELLKKVDDAWIEFGRWTNEVVAPRFYKEKKGRKMVHVNPWKDMKERMVAEEKTILLHEEWLHLFQHYIAQTGERPVLPVLYKKVETPDGDRMVRTSRPAPH